MCLSDLLYPSSGYSCQVRLLVLGQVLGTTRCYIAPMPPFTTKVNCATNEHCILSEKTTDSVSDVGPLPGERDQSTFLSTIIQCTMIRRKDIYFPGHSWSMLTTRQIGIGLFQA